MKPNLPSTDRLTVPHTKRQSITTRSGAVLERAYVFMPSASWEALQTLCMTAHQSSSQVIESLISNAISGNQSKDINEQTSPSLT
jgi:hypothetical protein